MRHHDKRKRSFTFRYGHIAAYLTAVPGGVSDVLNISELLMFEIGLSATDLGDFPVSNQVIRTGITGRRVSNDQGIPIF